MRYIALHLRIVDNHTHTPLVASHPNEDDDGDDDTIPPVAGSCSSTQAIHARVHRHRPSMLHEYIMVVALLSSLTPACPFLMSTGFVFLFKTGGIKSYIIP